MSQKNVKSTGLSANLREFTIASTSGQDNRENPNESANLDTTATIEKNVRVTVSSKSLKKKRSIWKSDKQKWLKSLGREYIGVKRCGGKRKVVTRATKKIKPACLQDSRCRKGEKKCALFETRIRKKICLDFWEAGDKNRKMFLLKHILNEKRGDASTGDIPDSRKYTLPFKDEAVPVCSLMFTATLAIDRTYISRLLNESVSDDLYKPIRECPNALKEAHLDMFLKSLETLPSHYNRLNSDKKYLSRSIESVSQLFQEYKTREEAAGFKPFAKSKFFEQFAMSNYSIYTPLRDRCELCQQLEGDIKNSKPFAEENMQKHRNEV